MGSTIEDQSVPLPTAELKHITTGVSLLPPLTRRGDGPGLIIVLPYGTPAYENGGTVCDNGVPPPLLKWSEEGFAVVQILESALDEANSPDEIFRRAVLELKNCAQYTDENGIGLVVYDARIWNRILSRITMPSSLLAVVLYGNGSDIPSGKASVPCMLHLTGTPDSTPTTHEVTKHYTYPALKSSRFAIPGLSEFDYASEAVAHTRDLTFLKKYIRGADFDLEAIWEEHTYWEFDNRSVEQTMATMVQEPYVNHIPTITGGIGRKLLTNFYRDHFIFSNPKDTTTELVSRTIGIDRICDEFIFSLTHDSKVDWLLPGIPPTGRKLRIAFTAVVCIRGDRLYHEHIAWDQASVLMQLGLLPEYLPYPFPLPDGRTPGPGERFEYRVPAAGVETVTKMVDKNGVKSNEMFAYDIRVVKT